MQAADFAEKEKLLVDYVSLCGQDFSDSERKVIEELSLGRWPKSFRDTAIVNQE